MKARSLPLPFCQVASAQTMMAGVKSGSTASHAAQWPSSPQLWPVAGTTVLSRAISCSPAPSEKILSQTPQVQYSVLPGFFVRRRSRSRRRVW